MTLSFRTSVQAILLANVSLLHSLTNRFKLAGLFAPTFTFANFENNAKTTENYPLENIELSKVFTLTFIFMDPSSKNFLR